MTAAATLPAVLAPFGAATADAVLTPFGAAMVAYAALCAATVVALLLIDAPYGRHSRAGWGPTLPPRWAWVLMESPAVLGAAALFLAADVREPVRWLFFALWQLHYCQRTFVFPLLLRPGGKRMPLFVAALGFLFNVFNAWANMAWIAGRGAYGPGWWADPRFLLGCTLFATGWLANLRSDQILRSLRTPGETGYRIPRGFLFRYVSCPNYLGEMVEWLGWALLTWSPAGLCFALYTAANLGPRALANHRWYRDQFPDYPKERRALVPFVL